MRHHQLSVGVAPGVVWGLVRGEVHVLGCVESIQGGTWGQGGFCSLRETGFLEGGGLSRTGLPDLWAGRYSGWGPVLNVP